MPTADKFQWPQGQPLFDVQWRAVSEAVAGNGITAPGDMEVSATGTDLEIEVASGSMVYNGTTYTFASPETHTLVGGDSTYDRWDTVYFNTTTTSSGVRTGTPEASPTPPDISGSEVLLAVVYVPQNATDVPSGDVLNWRATSAGGTAAAISYDDSTGAYGESTVGGALDTLSAASQVSAYPLAPATDLAVSGYPFTLADLDTPFGLPNVTDTDLSSTDLTDSGGPGVVYDAGAGEVAQNVLGGPASELSQYPLEMGTDVTHPSLASGTVTHAGGGGATTLRVPGVSTNENVTITVDHYTDSTGFSGISYGYSLEWWTEYDAGNSEVDVVLQMDWQTDPGNGNNLTVGYEIKEAGK